VAAVEPEWGRLTNRYHAARPNQNPSDLACVFPYQTLPDPVLAVRNPLVHLVWSPIHYHGLPKHRSGWASILLHYYQTLPPGLLNTHMKRGLTISRHTDPDVAHLFRRMIRWLITANIILGTLTLFNLYIYPEHIWERPDPILHSKPANQLHPYEI